MLDVAIAGFVQLIGSAGSVMGIEKSRLLLYNIGRLLYFLQYGWDKEKYKSVLEESKNKKVFTLGFL